MRQIFSAKLNMPEKMIAATIEYNHMLAIDETGMRVESENKY